MKLTTFSVRDFDDKLTGHVLIDISDRDKAKVEFVLNYLANIGGWSIANCPNEEDGVYSDSISVLSCEVKLAKEYYKDAKTELQKLIKSIRDTNF